LLLEANKTSEFAHTHFRQETVSGRLPVQHWKQQTETAKAMNTTHKTYAQKYPDPVTDCYKLYACCIIILVSFANNPNQSPVQLNNRKNNTL